MKLYNLSQAQEQILSQQLQQLGSDLLKTNFDDPTKDQAMIRWHAYTKGKFDAIKAILEDEFPDPDYGQEAQPATQL